MNYHMPTQIIFGSGTIAEIDSIVRENLQASRPFLVTDRGIEAAGILNRVKDPLALEASRLIFRFLPGAYQDIRNDAEAREGLMLGSLLAGMAFGNSDVGAVHCLAEAIGSLYDTPHGVANAVFLPFVMEFNLKAVTEKYANIATVSGIEAEGNEEAAARLIHKIRAYSRALSIPSFQDLGIPESDFALIALKSFENNSNPSNPRPVSADDYLAILKRAHEAKL